MECSVERRKVWAYVLLVLHVSCFLLRSFFLFFFFFLFLVLLVLVLLLLLLLLLLVLVVVVVVAAPRCSNIVIAAM